MALVSMWPPANGAPNTITFDGRTYSSTPGNSIQVQSFDIPVMQANGWTTFATVAGQNWVPMTPPPSGLFNTISFDGRTYSATPGTLINVPVFDAGILQANGWTHVFSTTLNTLTLSNAIFFTGVAAGTFAANINGTTSGSTITVTSTTPSGNVLSAVQVSANVWQLQTNSSTPTGAQTITANLQETLAGATNTPNATTGLSVSELANPVNLGPPVITDTTQPGVFQVGDTLSASTGSWNPGQGLSYAYEWKRSGTNISGATFSTYTLVDADETATITVTVIASAGTNSTPGTSSATQAIIGAIPVNTATPTLNTRSPVVGSAITSSTGTWTHSAHLTYAYQWLYADTSRGISGATSNSYTPVSSDVGHTLLCQVTATNSDIPYTSSPASSAASNAVTSGGGSNNTLDWSNTANGGILFWLEAA
jgi:hypothetical protein